jgi:hypothetical protein
MVAQEEDSASMRAHNSVALKATILVSESPKGNGSSEIHPLGRGRPNSETGGEFYQQPATELKTSGKIEDTVNPLHAKACGRTRGATLFGQTLYVNTGIPPIDIVLI